MAGVIQFAIGLAVLAVLIALSADRLWRLPLLLMFWGAPGATQGFVCRYPIDANRAGVAAVAVI